MDRQVHWSLATAAATAAAPDGAVSFESASAAWQLLPGWPERVHVSVPHGRSLPACRGVRLHRTRPWEPGDVTTLDGVPVTTVERTLVDMAPQWDRPTRTAAAETAIRRGLSCPERLVDTALRLRGPGRQGPVLVIALLLSGPEAAETHRRTREALARRVFERFALGGAAYEVTVPTPAGVFDCDVVWHDRRVIVEIETPCHDRVERRNRNRIKDAALHAAGWCVIRVRYLELLRSPARVVDRVARAAGGAGSTRGCASPCLDVGGPAGPEVGPAA